MTVLHVASVVLSGVAAMLAGLWALFAFYEKKQNGRVMMDKEISLKLTELQLKILQVEKDVAEIRKQHDWDYEELRKDFVGGLQEFKAANHEINSQIMVQLKTMNDLLLRLDVSFQNHLENHRSKQRKNQGYDN